MPSDHDGIPLTRVTSLHRCLVFLTDGRKRDGMNKAVETSNPPQKCAELLNTDFKKDSYCSQGKPICL